MIARFERIPHGAIALLARVSIATTFWLSGQTKIEGLVLDPIGRTAELGVPRMSENAVELFRNEYALPLIPPELAAVTAAVAEHLFPLLLLVGLASRFSALALLVMTLVIQVFVYPSAFATHGLWAAALLYLIARGPGAVSLDHLIARRARARPRAW
ncbi:DoxX family protein [Luteimonas sp. SJ-92]|uniref:DoxX family protein n=2 Tax=Luteimonas salinisoli TaxID=2752307 RepID=A0A853JDF5_9GAMM|nr:DoxX family protein [Luteimonas salinisoli]